MSSYNYFAEYYDKLMYDVDYTSICSYVINLAKKNGLNLKNLIEEGGNPLAADLGCGTGKACNIFSKMGLNMIGIDNSEQMLGVAAENARLSNQDILYLYQDMTDFELYGTVALITCLTDGVNHITDSRKLRRMFYWAHNYLDPSGLFIFDVNTEEKFSYILKNKVFYQVSDDVSYIWQSKLNKGKKICEFDLTFFIKEKNGFYKREEAVIKERIYSKVELTDWLKAEGFKTVKTYRKKDRMYYVCKAGDKNY